jgi:hypothetical protein
MNDDHLLEPVVGIGIADHRHPGREAGAGAEQEQPAAGDQRVADERAGRLAAEIDVVADLDLLKLGGQRPVGHLDRGEFQLLVIGRARDRIGAQQRLAVLAGQPDHHELARTEAEARRAGDAEAEQMLVPVPYAQHRLAPQARGGLQRPGCDGGNGIGHRTGPFAVGIIASLRPPGSPASGAGAEGRIGRLPSSGRWRI